jgi:hypothetical protein
MAAYSAIIVALISGPIMWLLYRLEKKNTEQHGSAVELIKSVKKDVSEVKDMQVWMDLKLDRHVEQDHNAPK